jgi:hypothetical protein
MYSKPRVSSRAASAACPPTATTVPKVAPAHGVAGIVNAIKTIEIGKP